MRAMHGHLASSKKFPSFSTLLVADEEPTQAQRYRSDAQLQADIMLDNGGYNQLLLREQ